MYTLPICVHFHIGMLAIYCIHIITPKHVNLGSEELLVSQYMQKCFYGIHQSWKTQWFYTQILAQILIRLYGGQLPMLQVSPLYSTDIVQEKNKVLYNLTLA